MITPKRFSTLVLAGGTLLMLLLILTDWWPYLRGPAPETPEWYWPYGLRPYTHWLIPLLGTLLYGATAVWWLHRQTQTHRRVWPSLLLLAAVSLLLQLALISADPPTLRDELINRVYTNLDSGFFQPAAELLNLSDALRDYPTLMPTFSSDHARTHPPGLVAANRLTMEALAAVPVVANRLAAPAIAARCIDPWLLERPTAVAASLLIWAILPLLAAAFTIFPAYGLARKLLPPTAVPLATLLTATLPALLLFAPKSVQFYAPLTLLIFLTFIHGWQNWRLRWFFLSGLLYSLATFLSLGNAALGLPLLLYALLTLWTNRHAKQLLPAWRTLLIAALIWGGGASALWLLYWAGWGITPWQISQVGLDQHYSLVTQYRNYGWWLVWNWVDVLVFMGWIVLAGATAVTLRALRHPHRTHWRPAHILALSTFATLLLLDLSGSARGEVGRIWLFLMPLLATSAADWLAEAQPGWRRHSALVGGQLLLTLALALAWQPVREVVILPQMPNLPTAKPETAVSATFPTQDGSNTILSLHGTTITPAANQLAVTLFWQINGTPLRPYTVFNQLLNSTGQVVAQQDNWPGGGQWPPTCWVAGQTIVDTYTLPLPAPLPPDTYTLITGWYDAANGRRLLQSTQQDHLILGQWQVENDVWTPIEP
jgi:hypothetical protein